MRCCTARVVPQPCTSACDAPAPTPLETRTAYRCSCRLGPDAEHHYQRGNREAPPGPQATAPCGALAMFPTGRSAPTATRHVQSPSPVAQSLLLLASPPHSRSFRAAASAAASVTAPADPPPLVHPLPTAAASSPLTTTASKLWRGFRRGPTPPCSSPCSRLIPNTSTLRPHQRVILCNRQRRRRRRCF